MENFKLHTWFELYVYWNIMGQTFAMWSNLLARELGNIFWKSMCPLKSRGFVYYDIEWNNGKEEINCSIFHMEFPFREHRFITKKK